MIEERQKIVHSLFKDGRYSCDLYGNVYSCKSTWGKAIVAPKILRPFVVKAGYKQYVLNYSKNTITVKGHQLVWLFFNPRYSEKLYLNHIDCNKGNNSLSNLELVTRLQNAQHAVAAGRYKRGEDSKSSNLTTATVKKIKQAREAGKTLSELQEIFEVPKSTLYWIISGRTWTHV